MAHKIPCLWNDCPNLLDGALKERYCRTHKELRKKNQKIREETSEFKNKKVWPKKKYKYSPAWSRCRKLFIKKHPFCKVCDAPTEEVHHKVPVRVNPKLELNWSNLVPYCRYCHHMAHKKGEL